MVHTTPTHFLLEQGPATVRALRSLSRRDADAVRATIRAAGGEWTVEEHDDYDGYLSLLIAPARDGGPAYLIAGRTDAVEVAELRSDEMIALGSFPGIGAATAVLRRSLAASCWAANPVQTATQRAVSPQEAARAAEQMIERHGSDAGLHAAMRADTENELAGEVWRAVVRAIDKLQGSIPAGT
jgi:hypothetical protein